MTIYYKNRDEPITQGAILSNFAIYYMEHEDEKETIKQVTLKYGVIISQACDIEQSINSKHDNNKLLNVIVLPMYIIEEFQEGRHLQDDYAILQRPFNTSDINKLKKNHSELRYHFLSKDDDLMKYDTVIDFKHYYTIPKKTVIGQYKEKHIATINDLQRSLLSQRFCNYLSRIAIPTMAFADSY